MGFDYELPDSLHVVTVKKRLIIPVPVQLETNPNEGAFQYLTKNRKHFMQSLDGILLDWNAAKIRLKNKAVPPYFQARVTIKGEFTILRVQQGDNMTALIVDQKPSAIVARTLENFLVHIEIPNEEIVFSPGDEVQFAFDCFDWEDANPVIYGVNPVRINILQHPVSRNSNIERQESCTQQKRKAIDASSTGPIRKKTRIEENPNNQLLERIESDQTSDDPGDKSGAKEKSSTAHESPQRVATSKENVSVEANNGVSIQSKTNEKKCSENKANKRRNKSKNKPVNENNKSNERKRCSEVERIENEINTEPDVVTTGDESTLVEPEIIYSDIDCVQIKEEIEIKSEITPAEITVPPVEITECDSNFISSEFSRNTTPKLSQSQTPKSQRRSLSFSENTPSVSSCSLMGQSDDCANKSSNLLESEDIVDVADSLDQDSTTQSSPKPKGKEVPPGWIRKLHTCQENKRKYHTYHSPLNRSFKSLTKAWEHHNSMMQLDSNQDNVKESVQLTQNSNSQNEIKGIKSLGSKSSPLDDVFEKKMKLVISGKNDLFSSSKEGPTLKVKKGHKKIHTDDAESETDEKKALGPQENNVDELLMDSDTQPRKQTKRSQGKGVMSLQRKKKMPNQFEKEN